MRNAVAFANNDVATIAWSYGAKPEGCMGFALYRIDSKGKETVLPNHAVFPGGTIADGQTTLQVPIQKTWEAGAWQVSADSMDYGSELHGILKHCRVYSTGFGLNE